MRCPPTLLLAFTALLIAAATGVGHGAPPAPVVVELFTSEGCSDCPPADVLLDKLIADGAQGEVIGLGEHVDYWDRQGWKDRFSSAALTDRQRAYQTHFATESIYTPQMVVDGRTEFVGSDAGAARRAIARAMALPHGVVRISVDGTAAGDDHRGRAQGPGLQLRIDVSDLPPRGRGDRAEIVLAIVENGLRSDVKRGENRGRTLTHAAVVRYMATVGDASTDASASARVIVPLEAEWRRERLKLVAFVQEQRSRAILASAAVPVAPRP